MNAFSYPLEAYLRRLLVGARDGTERLVTNLRQTEREISALSLNYNGHSLRAGIQDATLSEIDEKLAEAAATFSRTIFDVHQRLLLDVVALDDLARIEHVTNLEDERPLAERANEALTHYITGLGPGISTMREMLLRLTIQFGDLASNTEISACRAAAPIGVTVEVFITIAAHLRTLAERLRHILDDLTIFEQTQQGHADAARSALLASAAVPVDV